MMFQPLWLLHRNPFFERVQDSQVKALVVFHGLWRVLLIINTNGQSNVLIKTNNFEKPRNILIMQRNVVKIICDLKYFDCCCCST